MTGQMKRHCIGIVPIVPLVSTVYCLCIDRQLMYVRTVDVIDLSMNQIGLDLNF